MSWKRDFIAVLATLILIGVACGTNGTPSPSGPRLGGIQGAVTGESGEPVPGVRVLIVSGTAAFPEIAPATDEKGLYQIGGVNPGTFEVAFHDPNGDRIGLESVTVEGGLTSRLDLQIREQSIIVSWTQAMEIIMSGQVQQVAQAHSREVTVFLKDGQILDPIEPEDEVFRLDAVIERCGEPCSDIVRIAE